jgi:hypothetical protein
LDEAAGRRPRGGILLRKFCGTDRGEKERRLWTSSVFDLGKVSSQVCILTEDGELIERRIRTDREHIYQLLAGRERLRKEKEAKAAGATSGAPSPTPAADDFEEFQRRSDEERKKFEAEIQRQVEQTTREAFKPLPPVKLPPTTLYEDS